MLKKQGHQILGNSEEYEQAFYEISKLKPDVVLIDIRLEGDKDGIDLARSLEKEHIKYLYVSSLADPLTQQKLAGTNPLGFIDKPFTEFGFQNHITQLCKSA